MELFKIGVLEQEPVWEINRDELGVGVEVVLDPISFCWFLFVL